MHCSDGSGSLAPGAGNVAFAAVVLVAGMVVAVQRLLLVAALKIFL